MNEHRKGFKARHKQKVASIEPTKPRNFVAKNAINSGAGVHKDKKKAMKQGDNKHKKADYAESLELQLGQMLNELKDTTKVPQVKENSNPEYDDEAGMSHNSLHTIMRAANGLAEIIDEGDNLPEWCQEKLSIAEDYLVTVWDYLQSEKEQGVAEGLEIKIPTEDGITMQDIRLMAGEGKLTKKTVLQAIAVIRKQRRPQGVSEKLNLKAMDVGAVIKDFEKSNAPQFRGKTKEKRKQMAIAAKMGAMKPKKKKAHEGWTTDSLADQLFEHERTYEDKLNNMLNKKIPK